MQVKHDFSFEGQKSIPLEDLAVLVDAKIFFQNMVMLHIKWKGIKHTITY